MKIDHNEQQNNEYNFSYIENEPNSLVMTRKPSLMISQMFQLPIYIWIDRDFQDKDKDQVQMQAQVQDQVKIQFRNAFSKRFLQDLHCYGDVGSAKQFGQDKKSLFLICSQQMAEQVNKQFDKDDRVKSIICFGVNQKYPQLIAQRKVGAKFILFTNNEFQVFRQVKQNGDMNFQEKQQINFISLNKKGWQTNNFLRTILVMISQKSNRQEMVEIFKGLVEWAIPYKDKYKEQIIKQMKIGPLEPSKAIYWYTNQTFFYRLINLVLRSTKNLAEIFNILPYFQDLFTAIRNSYQKQRLGQNSVLTCYRGCHLSQQQFNEIKSNIGGIVYNLGFLSTSKNQKKAIGFIKNTFITIQIKNNQINPEQQFGFADISQSSASTEQQQILFNPLNSFKIISATIIQGNIYSINLEFGQIAKIMSISIPVQQKQKQQEKLKTDQKIIRQAFIDLKKERKQLNNLGAVLTFGHVSLPGSQQFLYKYLQIAQKSNNKISIQCGLKLLGDYLRNKGHFKKSSQILQKLLQTQKQLHKQSSIQYLHTILRLGTIYDFQGQKQKSFKYHNEGVQISKNIFGQTSYQYSMAINNLAGGFFTIGQYNKAIQYYEIAKPIKYAHSTKYSVDYSRLLRNLSNSYREIGQFDKAKQYALEALQIAKSYGEEHPQYASCVESLAIIIYYSGDCQGSLKLFQQSLEINKKVHSEYSMQYEITLQNIGEVYAKLGQIQKAKQICQKCIMILQKIGKKQDYCQISICKNLVYCSIAQNDLQKAKYYTDRCKKISQSFPPESYYKSFPLICQARLASYSKQIDSLQISLEIYNQAMQLISKKLSTKNFTYLQCQKEYQTVVELLQLKRKQKML